MQGLVAAVLAAGAGRRAGGPKALLTLKGRTFLAWCVAALRAPGVDAVVVVVGHQPGDVEDEARRAGADATLLNAAPDDGMLGSVVLALQHAEERGASGLLLHPVDHPLVEAATVAAVVEALRSGATIAVPSFERRRGHPVGFAASAFPLLRAAPVSRGARAVLEDHPGLVTHVPGDAWCRRGVNTPDDYVQLARDADTR